MRESRMRRGRVPFWGVVAFGVRGKFALASIRLGQTSLNASPQCLRPRFCTPLPQAAAAATVAATPVAIATAAATVATTARQCLAGCTSLSCNQRRNCSQSKCTRLLPFALQQGTIAPLRQLLGAQTCLLSRWHYSYVIGFLPLFFFFRRLYVCTGTELCQSNQTRWNNLDISCWPPRVPDLHSNDLQKVHYRIAAAGDTDTDGAAVAFAFADGVAFGARIARHGPDCSQTSARQP